MEKFNGYRYTGKTDKDNKAILDHVTKGINLTIDEHGRVFNEGGQYIADAVDTGDNGSGILCR